MNSQGILFVFRVGKFQGPTKNTWYLVEEVSFARWGLETSTNATRFKLFSREKSAETNEDGPNQNIFVIDAQVILFLT